MGDGGNHELNQPLVAYAQAVKSKLEPVVEKTKPYFIGQSAIVKPDAGTPLPRFEYAKENGPVKKTLLNQWHRDNGGDMVDFGGWDMPVKYKTSIAEEHRAVRTAGGLFDVSHMSAVAFQGPHALAFLEMVLANSAARLIDNEAQYT